MSGENIQVIDNDQTAQRIQEKRLARRRKKIDKARHSIVIVLTVIIIGLVTYSVMELRTGIRSNMHPVKAQASGIDQKAMDIYAGFVTVGTSSLKLALPGKMGAVIAVGFHQADRRESAALQPLPGYFDRESTATVGKAVRNSEYPVLFVMESRGRGSSLTSAADVAMKAGSEVYSPVDGIVRKVVTYSLYGKLMDNHVEIEPDGYPDLRLAIIHITGVRVSVGQRVKRQSTSIAVMRPLPEIQSQINKYLPEKADHVHLQINPATVEGKMKS